MAKHISIIGIDGSGKSTITEILPSILAGELNATIGSAGDSFKIISNDQDICGPNFYPRQLPRRARFAQWSGKVAERLVNNRKWYPVFTFLQMFFQDAASRRIADKNNLDLFVSNGNTILNSCGRQAHFSSPAGLSGIERESRSLRESFSHAFYYLLLGDNLSSDMRRQFPDIDKMRRFSKAARRFGCEGLWLPDLVIFLDITPAQSLQHTAIRRNTSDVHENLEDFTRARRNYLTCLKVFQEYRGNSGSVHLIHVDDLSTDHVIRAIVNIIKEHHVSRTGVNEVIRKMPRAPADTKLEKKCSVIAKPSNLRYLFSYLIGKCTKGAWCEPLFLFSRPGRQFLNQGYSASVIRSIYDHDPKKSTLMERVFINYPLHRAVQDRLQILTKNLEKIIRRKLAEYGQVTIVTAPSGFSYDLFKPLENIAIISPHLMGRIKLFASDLDPAGVIEPELTERAKRLGISFAFVKGDLASAVARKTIQNNGPFDIALFVGLSIWFPKQSLFAHLRWMRHYMEWDSVLVTDCFTPDAYALSGSYIGYKAHYYSPWLYSKMLAYCGFDGEMAVVESGRNNINHVVITCPKYALEMTMLKTGREEDVAV